MFVAGDVGGTKTLLGAFEPAADRPRAIATHGFVTNDYRSFVDIIDEFERSVGRELRADAVVVGVAGPVVGGRARLTNVAWDISASEVAARLGGTHVQLLNDLEAIANSVESLTSDEVCVLREGVPRSDGNAAVIAAGTGLGEAFLHRVDGRLRPVPSEGGHADFAARTDRELELVKMLRGRYGRAEVEHVLSGPGLVNLHRFTHRGGQCGIVDGVDEADAPPLITQAGMSGRCQQCADALWMFAAAYGAEAGNMALRGVATSGLYIGGGIAPRVLPVIRSRVFMDAFLTKEPMRDLLERVPVKVILNTDAGLLGAAVRAQELARHGPG